MMSLTYATQNIWIYHKIIQEFVLVIYMEFENYDAYHKLLH